MYLSARARAHTHARARTHTHTHTRTRIHMHTNLGREIVRAVSFLVNLAEQEWKDELE
jgi:phage terminase small subunit